MKTAGDCNSGCCLRVLARTMYKFSTAATKSSGVLHRLCDPQASTPDPLAGAPGLLNVPVGVSRWLTRTE